MVCHFLFLYQDFDLHSEGEVIGNNLLLKLVTKMEDGDTNREERPQPEVRSHAHKHTHTHTHTHSYTHTLIHSCTSRLTSDLCPQGSWGSDRQEEEMSLGEVRVNVTTNPSSTAAAGWCGHASSSPGQISAGTRCLQRQRTNGY